MDDFYRDIPLPQAVEMERLSRLIHELRSHRAQLLSAWQVDGEAPLAGGIERGEVDEHPAYEAWLSLRILEDTREVARTVLARRLDSASRG